MAELRLQLDAERRRNVDAEAQHERAERAVRQEAEEQRMRVLFLEKARGLPLYAASTPAPLSARACTGPGERAR